MQRAAVFLLAVAWGSVVSADSVAAPQEPAAPLTALHCADHEGAAREALERLAVSTSPQFTVPVEVPAAPSASAVFVDLVLREAADAVSRWPQHRDRIEAVVMSWSYCDVFYGGEGWNLALMDGKPVRVRAIPPADGWRGFAAWGLVTNEARIIPRLFEQNGLGRGQREWFIGVMVSERCFPHPTTGLTPFMENKDDPAPNGSHAREVANLAAPPAAVSASVACPVAVKSVAQPEAIVVAPEVTVREAEEGPPMMFSQGASSDTLTTAPPPSGALGLSGVLYETLALAGRASTGARLSWSPVTNAFVRVGIVQPVASSRSLPTYSWGIGYGDWRPNTISVELNNWGPIPINQVDFKGATANLGYKVGLPTVLANFFSLSLNVSYQIQLTPSLGFGLGFKPWRSWFINGGMRWDPTRPSRFTWSYGFGNFNWKPYTFSLAYNNWGPNEAFQPNFQQNGALTLGWSWAL